MKKFSKIASFLLALMLVLSVCSAASASVYPNPEYLYNFVNGDQAQFDAKMAAFYSFYNTFASKYGNPASSPSLYQYYQTEAAKAGFTGDKGYSFSSGGYTPPKPVYPVYPNYSGYLPCPIWGCTYPYGLCPNHHFSTAPAGYPDPAGAPYYAGSVLPGAAAPVAPAEPQRVVRLASCQEEYAVHFLTGETSVSGNRLIFKTKTRDAAELKRSDIFVTSAKLNCSDGNVYSWDFGTENTGIARLEIAFGGRCNAQLTVVESNGYGSDEVNCAKRTVSGAGGEHIISLTTYDINGKVLGEYDAQGNAIGESANSVQPNG